MITDTECITRDILVRAVIDDDVCISDHLKSAHYEDKTKYEKTDENLVDVAIARATNF